MALPKRPRMGAACQLLRLLLFPTPLLLLPSRITVLSTLALYLCAAKRLPTKTPTWCAKATAKTLVQMLIITCLSIGATHLGAKNLLELTPYWLLLANKRNALQ